MPAGIEVNLLLHPVGLWRLANQNPISGKPISVKHEPDVRPHQRLWTTVPAWQRVKTTVPARAARTGDLFSRRFVGTSEHSQAVIVTEHAVACRSSIICGTEKAFSSHGYHQ